VSVLVVASTDGSDRLPSLLSTDRLWPVPVRRILVVIVGFEPAEQTQPLIQLLKKSAKFT